MLLAAVSDGNSFSKDLNKDLRDGWFNLYNGISVAKNADMTFPLKRKDSVLMETCFACLVFFLFKALS